MSRQSEMARSSIVILLLSIAISTGSSFAADASKAKSNSLKLWYTTPATQWMEALPIGNGRIGVMVWGQTHHETLSLNESTCWSGKPSTENVNPNGPKVISAVRQMIFDGEWNNVRQTMPQLYGQNRKSFGTNLELGRLILDFDHDSKHSRKYRRDLDIETGIASVSYENSNVIFTQISGDGFPDSNATAVSKTVPTVFNREVFVSNPDNVVVVSVTSSKPGAVTFFAKLDGGDNPFNTKLEGKDTLLLDGDAFETLHSDGKTGVHFHGRLKIITKGGKVNAVNDRLQVENADSAMILMALGTTFQGNDPVAACKKQISDASKKEYSALKQTHVNDHQRLFKRVDIDLGQSPHPDWPTDKRVEAVRKGQADPALVSLLFQYARYLIIAGSRENSPLPMHLQGIWNDNVCSRMPWSCDYHLDINLSMYYWPTGFGNLSECDTPLMHWVNDILRPSGRNTAKVMYGCPGWTADVMATAWGYSAPGWGGYSPFVTAGTWISSHMWDHYIYTGDKKFLAEKAYPTLKENAEFFVNYMTKHPKYGWYVTGPSSSPENSFIAPDGKQTSWSMAPTVDVVLIKQLFTSCIDASEILNVDKEFSDKLVEMRSNLPPFKIGKNGQLQEWLEDYNDAIPGHRHTSHLLASYPYGLINPDDTPELAKAVKVTIDRRVTDKGWEDNGWSRSLLAIQLARLCETDAAYAQLQKYMEIFVFNNLFSFCWGGHTGARYPILNVAALIRQEKTATNTKPNKTFFDTIAIPF